jgi:hypothetical protein
MERENWRVCLGGRVRWCELECMLGNGFYRPLWWYERVAWSGGASCPRVKRRGESSRVAASDGGAPERSTCTSG